MANESATPGEQAMASEENFAAMLEESFVEGKLTEGSVVKGTVISIENDSVLIDVGLKSEGRVSAREFTSPGQEIEIGIGDLVDVYLERMEDKNGEAGLSPAKARRGATWAPP